MDNQKKPVLLHIPGADSKCKIAHGESLLTSIKKKTTFTDALKSLLFVKKPRIVERSINKKSDIEMDPINLKKKIAFNIVSMIKHKRTATECNVQEKKDSLEKIISTHIKNKLGLDFYNRTKIHVLLSKQKDKNLSEHPENSKFSHSNKTIKTNHSFKDESQSPQNHLNFKNYFSSSINHFSSNNEFNSTKHFLISNNELFYPKNHSDSKDQFISNKNHLDSSISINYLDVKNFFKKENPKRFMLDTGREGSDEEFLKIFRQNRLDRAQQVIAEKKRDSMINLKVRKRFQNLLEKMEKKEEIIDPMQSESFRSIIRNGNFHSTDRKKTDLEKKEKTQLKSNYSQSNTKSKSNLKMMTLTSFPSIESGQVSALEVIQSESIDLKRRNKFLKKKLRRNEKSMNSEFSSLLSRFSHIQI